MTSVEVFGIKEALKELSSLDLDLRKQINLEAKTIAKPATDGIKAAYPSKYLSGMSKPWVQRGRQLFPYTDTAARKGVQLKIATGKKNVSVIGIEQKDAAAAIIDMAGTDKDLVIEGAEDKPLSYPFENVQIAPYDNETVAFQDLALGSGVRLDAMVTNLITARERIAQDPRFKIAGPALYAEPNVVAIEKGDPQWSAKVTEAIAGLKADGTLSKISQKWIGSDISQ